MQEPKKNPPITQVPVKSSNCSHAGFCPCTGRLAVTFKNGNVYHYHGLKQEDHDKLMAADSFGKYLNANIKGNFAFEKQDKS